MSEFSRRVDVYVFKDSPPSQFPFGPGVSEEQMQESIKAQLDRFQPYRWHAVSSGNGEIIAHGERYFNLADCLNAIELNYGDDTTVYRMPMFGDDRHEEWLRYGKTDRDQQAAQS